MAWCPNCKNEYVAGIKVCADCGVELVESLASLEAEIEDAKETDETENADENTDEKNTDAVRETEQKREWKKAYRDSASQAEENKSSAYTLLVVGVLGLIAVILVLTEILPLYQNAVMTKYLVCGVMGVLFILFIVFGIVSMKSFKILSAKAKTEDSLLSEITKWCRENMSAAVIDEGLWETQDIKAQDIPEEQKYFKRAEKMKQMIKDKFMNLDEDFLEHFVDDYYQNLFE